MSKVLFALGFLMIGMFIGVLFGVAVTIYSLVDSAKGFVSVSQININLNETKFVEEFNNTIVPEIRKEQIREKIVYRNNDEGVICFNETSGSGTYGGCK